MTRDDLPRGLLGRDGTPCPKGCLPLVRFAIPLFLWLTIACDTHTISDESPSRAHEVDQTEDWLDDPRENAVLQVVADAEATLMGSNGSELAIGLRCGLAPWPSLRPWLAVRYLLAARQEERLWRVVDEAPTSEGRIWAAYGLVEAHQFDDQDLADIADEAGAPIWTCDGCASRRATPSEAIGHL
jgi:hypothetical protein